MEYRGNIEKISLTNTFYRKILHTTSNMQLVVMMIKPGEEIGMEKHSHTSQFIRVESGKAKAIIGDEKYYLKDGDVVIIPPKTYHNIINRGKSNLHLYTIYTPPEHPKKLKQKNKPQN
jgi:mannose-6-phosphate isomerase-like protein (cupin superfamily)